jgi:hypothetical protein
MAGIVVLFALFFDRNGYSLVLVSRYDHQPFFSAEFRWHRQEVKSLGHPSYGRACMTSRLIELAAAKSIAWTFGGIAGVSLGIARTLLFRRDHDGPQEQVIETDFGVCPLFSREIVICCCAVSLAVLVFFFRGFSNVH